MVNTVKTHPALETRSYDVELNTALGKRCGQLKLQLSEGSLSGVLYLMKSENPIRGSVLADGTCSLTGSIRTRMGVYPFDGKGLLRSERIEAQLRCRGESLSLRGTRREE